MMTLVAPVIVKVLPAVELVGVTVGVVTVMPVAVVPSPMTRSVPPVIVPVAGIHVLGVNVMTPVSLFGITCHLSGHGSSDGCRASPSCHELGFFRYFGDMDGSFSSFMRLSFPKKYPNTEHRVAA